MMRLQQWAAALGLLLCFTFCSAFHHQNRTKLNIRKGPIVKTQYGSLQGIYRRKGVEVREFLGIPYAAPPVGDLRWQPPQEQKSWKSMYRAVKQPPGCPQKCGDPKLQCPSSFDEDCLYMNVYTPFYTDHTSNLPVIVFFHGGNFQFGGAGAVLYNGRYLANLTETVVVVTNYRLGPLGYMVTGGVGDHLTGNYGFLDQQASMKFVKNNIANFGGNPDKVTLYGQSCGAQSISFHLSVPESESLFQQAIISSLPLTLPYHTTQSGAQLGNRLAGILKCSPTDMKCLRSKTADEVIVAGQKAAADSLDPANLLQSFNPWSPVIDGDLIHLDPKSAFESGNFKRKPVIAGTTSEEGRLYVNIIFKQRPTFAKSSLFLYFLFKNYRSVADVINEYAHDIRWDLRDPISEGCTDLIFTCPTINASRTLNLLGSKIYHYIFDHAFSNGELWGSFEKACKGRACHGGELSYFFHNTPLSGFQYEATELRLVDSLVYYLRNFAYTSNPNNNTWSTGNSFEYWPPYSKSTGWPSMVLKPPKNVVYNEYRNEKCMFWNKFGYDEKKWSGKGFSHWWFGGYLILLVLVFIIKIGCRWSPRLRSASKQNNYLLSRKEKAFFCVCLLNCMLNLAGLVCYKSVVMYVANRGFSKKVV